MMAITNSQRLAEIKKKKEKTSVNQFSNSERLEILRFNSNLQKLNTDYTDLYTSYNSRFFDKDGNFNGTYGKTDNDSEYENYSQKAARLNNDIGEIQKHLKKYGNLYDGESLKNINAMLENASGGIKNMGQAYEFYSNFHTENDYNAYVMNNTAELEDGMSAEGITARIKAYEKSTARLEAIDNEIANMSDDEKWVEVLNPYSGSQMAMQTVKKPSEKHQELLDEKAKIQEANTEYKRYDLKRDKTMLRAFNNEAYAKFDYEEYQKDAKRSRYETYEITGNSPDVLDRMDKFSISPYKSNTEPYKGGLNDPLTQYLAFKGGTQTPENFSDKDLHDDIMQKGAEGCWEYLNEEEKKYYYSLIAENNYWDALDFLEGMRNVLCRRAEITAIENIKDWNGWDLAGANVVSIPANIIGGAIGFFEDAEAWSRGDEIDPYSLGHQLQTGAQIVRGETANRINYTLGDGEFLGVSWGDAYQAAMSGIDSVVGAVTFGKGYTVIMGMGAASSKAKQLYEQGASNGQIAAASLLSGVAEMAFEKFSIDRFLGEFVNAPTKKWYKLLGQTALQGGIEMTEEMTTELANIITDVMVLGSRSEWEKLITSYKEQGYSDWEAISSAMWDKGGDILEAGISGFISGTGMGAGGSVINAFNTNKAYNEFYTQIGSDITSAENIKSLVSAAKTLDNTKANAKVKALAAELESVDVSKLNAKEKTAFEKKAGQLYEAVLKAQNKQGKASFDTAKKNIIREQLNKKGITDEKEIEAATQAIMKVVYNKGALTAKESELLEKVGGNEIASYLINNAAEVTTEGIVTALNNKAVINETASLTKKQNTYAREINTDDYIYSGDGKTYIDGENTPVDISGIASIKNGRMTLELSDGRTAELGDVILGSETQAILYEGVLDMGVDAASAQAIVNSYDENAELGALKYVYGMRQAVEYGKIGAKAFLDTGAFTADLNPKQREMAYEIGKMTAENEAKHEAQRKQRTTEKDGLSHDKVSGGIRFDGITEKDLNETQRTTVSVFKQLFGGYGVTVEFFKSPVNERGTHTGENGSYDPNTNTIRLDINAGAQGKDTILFTAAHELTHFIKQWSPEKFRVFSEFLLDSHAKRGVSIDDLIKEQQAKAKRNGRELDYEEAYEEVVADSCETFLRDSRLFDKLLNLKQQDKGLFEKTKEYISKLFDKVAALRHKYKNFNPDSKEGNIVTQMTDAIEQLHRLWEDAAMTALDNSRRASGTEQQKNTAENGGEVKYCSRDNNPNSFNPEGATLKQQLNDAYYTSKSFDQRYVYVGRFSQDFINLLKKNKIILHNYPIAMNYRDAYLSMHSKETGKYHGQGINYHNLGITGLQEALESFKNPKHIIKSKKNGKIELALQTVDKKGNNVLSIVAINTVTLNGNKILDAHIVTSAYGKRNIDNYINVAKNEGRLIKHKKEESTQGTPQVQYEGSINANSSHRDTAERAGGVEINSGLSPTDNVSKNSIRNPESKVKDNVKKSDRDYLQAVNSDDIKTAQRLVDEAAKEAGYTIKSYHGTLAKDFTQFKKELIGSRFSFDEKGFFFIDRRSIAEDYATSEFNSQKVGRVLDVYLKAKNPLVVDSSFALKNGLGRIFRDNDVIDVWDNYCTYLLEEAETIDADAIVVDDGMSKMTVVFEPEQIKSADPVTYDDNGEVIPLSERFNDANKDIRYSVRENFYTEFDQWVADGRKDTNVRFVVGTTSEALKSIGMKDQEIILRSGTVNQKLNKNTELTTDIFRNIPDLLENPVIVQFSDAKDPKTNKPKFDTRITILGELYAEMLINGNKENRPVLVSLELLPTNQKNTTVLDFSIITSAYGHSKLQHYLNENSILYIDPNKKRTNKWLSLNRLQLPLGETKYGSIRKITYSGNKVKIQNSNNKTAMETALEKAGVVDEFGNAKNSLRDPAFVSEQGFGAENSLNNTEDEAVSKDEVALSIPVDKRNDANDAINEQEQKYIQKICDKLGRVVVFEDLREMYYKGEIISPDGYIENGVIHLNTYAENPIGFVFKHELTHFAEKASGYAEFVRGVKNSNVYKKWLCEKMGESDVKIAEYKYKQMVANTHSDIYSASDPKAEAEMIADFVGEMLFTKNGSGMASLVSDVEVKHRNKVVQFVLDLISYLKKRLSGIKALTLELSILEDSFNRIVSEATELENKGLYKYDDDISFCFVACTDQERINAAEELERQGYNRLYIFKNCGLIRDAYGKWKYELNTREFKFYADGNARTDSHYFNYKLQKPDGSFEGRLCDFVLFDSLFELYPQLKDITVVIKKADDTVRFIIDENDENGNDKEPILFINKRLSDDFKSSRNNDIKSYILRELQRAIQYINGEYIGKSLTFWENMEKEGKTPYSEKLGRKLTAQEAHKYTADNYEAKIVETRRALRDTLTKTDANKGRRVGNIDEAYLYSSSIERDMDILFDDNDNPFISEESLLPSKDNSISDNNEGTTAENEVVPSLSDGIEENDGNSFDMALKKNQNSNELRRFLSAARMIDKNDIAQNLNIRAGSDSLISDVADNAKQAAEYFNQDRINELSQKILQRIDSIGRTLSNSLFEKFKNTIFKNEKGKMISLYTLKMRGIGGFEHSKLGLVAGTLEAAEQLYAQYNDGSPRNRDVYIQEIFVNMKNPLVLHYTPYEDSIRGIHDLVEREIFFHSEFLNLINQKSAAKEPTYSGLTTRKTREAIQNAGYDGIIYFNNSTDKGSMTVIVFDESQMVTVAENGILQQNNGITDDYFDLAAAEDAAKKVNNDKNIKLYAADSKYNKRKYRPVPDERIKAGSGGFMEKITSNVGNAKMALEKNLTGNNEIALSGKDVAGRNLGKNITGECDKTFFKDKNGKLLSFFAYGKKIIDLEKTIKSRTLFGTLDSAINDLVLSKEKSPRSIFGVIQEFYINSVAPLIVELDNLDAEVIAKQIFEEGIITEKEYYRLISPERKNPALVLINKLDEKGFDSIVFVKQTGECAVLPFDATQVFPVADNGMLKDNSGVTQEDEIEEYNEKYRIDRVVIEREGETPIDTREIRSILTSERDNTIKMKLVTKVLMCNNNPAIDYSDNRTAGHSGILEKNKVNILNARAIVTALINRDFSDVSIADTDTAGRIISEYKRQFLRESKLIDKHGRPLSVFGFNRYGDYRFNHSQFGLRVGTLNAAHDTSLFERENSAGYISGSFEEYYPIVKNPYFLMFDPENLTPAMLAKYLLEEGTITNKQYEGVLVRLGADRTAYHSGASNYLTRILKEKGFDSLAFMNERADPGSIGFIVFDKSQLIPVAIDGLPVENSDRTLADSDNEPAFLMPENDGENFVEKSKENTFDNDDNNGYNEIKKVKCRNERLEGENHSVTDVPFVKKQIEFNGKIVEVVVPEFDSFFDAQLPKELYIASNPKQFKECNLQLSKSVEFNDELRKQFDDKQIKRIKKGKTPYGFTWHHDVAKGNMQLVDCDVHKKTGHTGGQYFWSGGTKNR